MTKAPKRDLALARTRLNVALRCTEPEQPTAAQLRKARLAAEQAIGSLDAHIAALMTSQAENNKAIARELAKSRRDARGRRRPPQTMPGYHKGRVSPNKGCFGVLTTEGK